MRYTHTHTHMQTHTHGARWSEGDESNINFSRGEECGRYLFLDVCVSTCVHIRLWFSISVGCHLVQMMGSDLLEE